MVIKECDKVMTIIDKSFDNGYVPCGTIGYVVDIAENKGTKHYLLEISDINHDDPLFDFKEEEIKLFP